MDEEELQDDLRRYPGSSVLPARLRSFSAVYLIQFLISLLLLVLSALALARVSSISSKLHQDPLERNFSDWDSFLFPCGSHSPDWEYFSGHCYYFSLARLSWERAREQCRERQAQLAVVGSFSEQQFLMSRTRNERFWIGLTDQNSEGTWEWIDGTDYGSAFTFWKEGEPNDSGRNEDCAHLWLGGRWNDVHCTFECFFICLGQILVPFSRIPAGPNGFGMFQNLPELQPWDSKGIFQGLGSLGEALENSQHLIPEFPGIPEPGNALEHLYPKIPEIPQIPEIPKIPESGNPMERLYSMQSSYFTS